MDFFKKMAAGGGVIGYRYWKITITENGIGDTGMYESELLEKDNGLAVTVLDTSSIISGITGTTGGVTDPVYATDGNLSTKASDVATDDYIMWDLGSGVRRKPKYVRIAGDTTKAIISVKVSYSRDGSSWTDSNTLAIGTVTNQQFSANNYIAITYP